MPAAQKVKSRKKPDKWDSSKLMGWDRTECEVQVTNCSGEWSSEGKPEWYLRSMRMESREELHKI